jgi:hypothetical protein
MQRTAPCQLYPDVAEQRPVTISHRDHTVVRASYRAFLDPGFERWPGKSKFWALDDETSEEEGPSGG